MKVAICIITYRRPEGLRRLLRGIDALEFTGPVPALEVVVVDNDATGATRPVCEQVSLRWPLRCVVEPERGIPQARNRAVREAQYADFIAFIDDDEVPAPNWLEELLRVQQAYDADVVAGPALAVFSPGETHWLTHSDFYSSRRHPTGHPLVFFSTCNLLLRASLFQSLPKPFDERMALTGGSDTMLSRVLHQQGARMVWADEAIVYEHVPPSRLHVRWVLQRALRTGNTFSITEAYVDASARTQVLRLIKGLRRIIHGLFTSVINVPTGRTAVLSALALACRGVGEVAGVLNLHYREYKHIHGS